MKKIIFFLFLFPFVSHAATLTLSAGTVEVIAGESVSIAVGADAGDEKLVTVKAALSYPPELLEFVSFSFATGAFALSQPGYDSAGEGALVKTAGFPGGFTGIRPFGTAVFRARSVGTAAISASSDSLLLNTQGVNRLTETETLTLAIAALAAPLSPAPLPQSAELTPAADAPATSFTPTTSVSEISEQSAAIGASTAWKSPLVIALVSLFAVGILAALAWRFIRT